MTIEAAAAEALARVIETEIEAWFVESMHGSPVSRATEIYNHVRIAADALKERLAAILQEQ
jgi:hypothetical protein